MKFALIAAADKNMGIGINNRLPWSLKSDLKYFSNVTCGERSDKINAVIMGTKTWESLPIKHRPLTDRLNVVLTKGPVELVKGKPNQILQVDSSDSKVPFLAYSLEEALEKLGVNKKIAQAFVVGGASLYAYAINHPDCKKIYLTEIESEFKCDTFFPKIPADFKKVSVSEVMEENGLKFRFVVYER